MDKYNILCSHQHGFRTGHSCETQLLTTLDDLAYNLNSGFQTDLVLLDFKKAFDKVPHHRLCYKLAHYGIRGTTLRWIQDFLTNRTQQVVVNGCSSSPSQVTSGVPQGSVLGPLLFICYINDLPKEVNSAVKLYADDVLLYRAIHSIADHDMLQKDLDIINKWAESWKMTFNLSKCELVRVTNKKHPLEHSYYLQGEQIKSVPHAKYLGVSI